MKLQIDRNKYPLNVSEQNKLLDFIKEKIILNIDESKLINWNEFIHSDKYKADKRTNNITATQIVDRGANNLVIDEEKATEMLKKDKVTLICDMKEGEASATAWGCDLTHEYVTINGDYRS